jgi:topoisomerase-4 subunit B
MATPSASSYNADAIEVLSGLDPVRKRPGMYTDTSRPNHLAQEVIDNSVDEALAGHAKSVQVILHADHSLEVSDDGRGMPVDIHPEEGVSGVELILTKLHAGGKFSNKNYQFSGGLHGVGISVVNALSTEVRVRVKRDGNEYQMTFADGYKATELEIVGTVGKRNTGTSVYFAPDPKYFDSPKFSISRLKHVLKAKAVLCPGLLVSFEDKGTGEKVEWHYEDGLRSYLVDAVNEFERLPDEPFCGAFAGNKEAVDWALLWLPEGGDACAGKLRQPDPDGAGRYPRQRFASGPARCDARVLRIPQPAAARREAGAGGRLGAHRFRSVDENAGAAILRPDQGTPVVP